MKSVIIIGGGVIGHFSAYYLAKSGHKVTLLDASDLTKGCSYGNAGMVVPSHLIPIAQPGMISKGIKWMFDAKSPFYIKPRASKDLLRWSLEFYKNANQKHVKASIPALRDISLLSKSLYADFTNKNDPFFYRENGLLMLYQTDKVGDEELEAAEVASKAGLKVKTYAKSELNKIEPSAAVNAIGGIHYESDAHLDPNRLMKFLKSELERLTVTIQPNCRIQNFVKTKGRIEALKTNLGAFKADEFIICSGSWTPEVIKSLGIQISILPGKGYSFNFGRKDNSPSIPSILCEGKVAVTPMQDMVRFGGTLELTHTGDKSINQARIQGITNTIQKFYPELNFPTLKRDDIWSGFRPCTPNGLPVISRTKKYNNLVIASGHGMMGLSLAPATGKLVESIISNKRPEMNINSFKSKS